MVKTRKQKIYICERVCGCACLIYCMKNLLSVRKHTHTGMIWCYGQFCCLEKLDKWHEEIVSSQICTNFSTWKRNQMNFCCFSCYCDGNSKGSKEIESQIEIVGTASFLSIIFWNQLNCRVIQISACQLKRMSTHLHLRVDKVDWKFNRRGFHFMLRTYCDSYIYKNIHK